MLARKIIYGIFSRVGCALISIGVVPIYLEGLGKEGFGFFTFFGLLQAMSLLFDIGLGTSLTRELAKPDTALSRQRKKSMLYLSVLLYAGIGVVLALGIAFAADWIVASWLNVELTTELVVKEVIYLMALAIAVSFPSIVLQAAIVGMQRQDTLSGLLLLSAIFRSLGAVVVLRYTDGGLMYFFSWQIVSNFVLVILLLIVCKSACRHVGLDFSTGAADILNMAGFSLNNAGNNITTFFATQADKIILSKVLSISEFGFYGVACMLASIPAMIISPIFNVVYPSFASTYKSSIPDKKNPSYHEWIGLVGFFVLPVGILFTIFSKEILLWWTGNENLSNEAWISASLLTVGNVLMAYAMIPYARLLANGNAQVSLKINVITLPIIIMISYGLTPYIGMAAGSIIGLALYAVQLSIMPRLLNAGSKKNTEKSTQKHEVTFSLFVSISIQLVGFLFISEISNLQLLPFFLVALYGVNILALYFYYKNALQKLFSRKLCL